MPPMDGARRVAHDVRPESPFALLGPEEVRAWFAFMKVHLRLPYEMNRQLRDDTGLSLADYDVLVALTSDPDATMTVTDIAIRIGAERSRVSHRIRRLADDDLVTLQPDADDRRATSVALTARGTQKLTEASPGHVAFVRRVFLDAVPPGRLDQLAEVFESVYDSLIDNGTLPRPADHP